MKALRIRQYGGSEVLEIVADAPQPVPGKGQVLVRVQAASINPIDWKVRQGYLKDQVPLTMPATLGGDFVGVMANAGDSDFTVGERIYGYASLLAGGSGSFAEYAAAGAGNAARAPEKATPHEAGALPLVGASAIQALEGHLKLQRGQTILIHGGGGGIGSLAIQLAKAIGAYVVTTATGDDLAYARSLGADEVIDYKSQSFETTGKKYDAVFDTVGGQTTAKSFQVLKRRGTLVSMLGADEQLATQHGVTAIAQFTRVTTDVLNRLRDLVDGGRLKIRIAGTFPLDQAKQAFDLAEHGHAKGKVVLDLNA
ncbi:MAG TPA: NADP-dependent oxidoreductase [Nitrospira sp.]|nr:NADP-dependent oxidoreductase [Nitrospira sp.]